MYFSGVDAHHTNGIDERLIQDVQDSGRTMLIHAAHRWKSNITTNLWPYALLSGSDGVSNSRADFPYDREAHNKDIQVCYCLR